MTDLHGITILQGDCLEKMKELESGSIDLVITSPPYNLGTTSGGGFPCGGRKGKWGGGGLELGYDGFSDDIPKEEYTAWQKHVLTECWRLISDSGAIFYNHKPRVQDGILWTPFDLNPGLPVRQVIIWRRSGGLNFSPTFYCPTHEWIVVFAKPEFRLRDESAGGIGDVWDMHQTKDKGNTHPAPFPLDLPGRILATTNGNVVLDPFAGSGTTGVACMKAGRRAILIEHHLYAKCQRKIRHETRAEAEAHVDSLVRDGKAPRSTLKVYLCGQACGGYHVGSKNVRLRSMNDGPRIIKSGSVLLARR